MSVALIGAHQTNPGSNINNNTQIGGGVEWNLVPYRKNENYQFMFRLGSSRSDLALDSPYKIGCTRDHYMFAFANFSAYWLLIKDKLIITANSYFSKNLKYDDNNFVQLNAKVGYKISNSFKLARK
ncbi:MAG: hypothetical protein KA715_04800 [Xanthomonadaceae bacterium]|nr:hypothetical protein [Xanthomonadaceae bacterium]